MDASPARRAAPYDAPYTPQSARSGYASPSPYHTGGSSSAPTPDKLQASIPVVMVRRLPPATPQARGRVYCTLTIAHRVVVPLLQEAVAALQTLQEENTGLRAQLELLRAAPAPTPQPAGSAPAYPPMAPATDPWAPRAAPATDPWAPRAAPPQPPPPPPQQQREQPYDVTPLCGAFEAQRQYLRGRSAGKHQLRKAIQRTDDRGIAMHLQSLEEQRTRHVRSEWKNLRKIQQMLEGELDMSLDVDGGFGSPMEDEGDFEGGLHEVQQMFQGSRGRAAEGRSQAGPTAGVGMDMGAHYEMQQQHSQQQHSHGDGTRVVMQQHTAWLANFSATH